jgi:hypothetical protein
MLPRGAGFQAHFVFAPTFVRAFPFTIAVAAGQNAPVATKSFCDVKEAAC